MPRKSRKSVIDGITFDSALEASRYRHLKARQEAGEISNLECHPRFPLVVNGVKIGPQGIYTADFRYSAGGVVIVEDVKAWAKRSKKSKSLSPRYERDFPLRRDLVLALYGISIFIPPQP
jgi:hypothetical protein